MVAAYVVLTRMGSLSPVLVTTSVSAYMQNKTRCSPRLGISVEGAHMYSTMQPCFGCAKEIVQARIGKVSYLHPWVPTDVDPVMDKAKKAEYEKIIAKLHVERIESLED